jgi:predicted TIM-barrel fold metal-dependent hydrolase
MTVPPFIDTHHHLWDLENNRYPWLQDGIDHFVGDYSPIRQSFLITEFLKGAEGLPLQKSVHVQAEWDHDGDPVGETAWLQRVADDPASRGMPNAIIGYANLADPNIEKTLARHAAHPNWRGIRHMLNWSDVPRFRFADRGDYMEDSQWQKGYRALGAAGGSFDMQIWPWQLEDGAKLAKRIPEVPVILNHTGMPRDWDADGVALWRNGMRAIAGAKNISVKISALGMMKKDWTPADIRPFVLDTIEIVGADRCMFASNFPVDSLFSDYATVWNAYDEITSGFSASDRAKLFHDNAETFYRI